MPGKTGLLHRAFGISEGLANRNSAPCSSPYPGTLNDFLREDQETRQGRSHATLSRLREGDYQALPQRTGEKQTFPLQLMILLSEPDSDFAGGELVMTEQ